jgi:hypothetical protein
LQTPLPAPYDACEKVATTVSSLALVRYRLNDYSVPTTYRHIPVAASCRRSVRDDVLIDPLDGIANLCARVRWGASRKVPGI